MNNWYRSQVILSLIACSLVAFAVCGSVIVMTNHYVSFPPALLVAAVVLLVGAGLLVRLACRGSKRLAESSGGKRILAHRLSVQGLMGLVAVASVISFLLYRSQEFRTRATRCAQMVARCNAARPYLYPDTYDRMVQEISDLKVRYTYAASHPWVVVEDDSAGAEPRAAQAISELLAAEARIESSQKFQAEARRRLRSRGPQLGRVSGRCGLLKNQLALRIHSNESFTLVVSDHHGEIPLGHGFASVVNGKIRLEFVEGEPTPGSSHAQQLSQIASDVDSLLSPTQ